MAGDLSEEERLDRIVVQQLAAQIPCFNNCVLLDKVKHPDLLCAG
jgi:hypothetical protein